VSFKGKYYTINTKLYNPSTRPIPPLTAATGRRRQRARDEFAAASGWREADRESLSGAIGLHRARLSSLRSRTVHP
jgi:hypothetical protein